MTNRKKESSLQDKYNEFLNDILSLNLFETGMALNSMLADKFNISPMNARQIVKRAVEQNIIRSSAPYTFGKRQYVYIFNQLRLDTASIKYICKKSRPPIYRLLQLMTDNLGIISYYEALKITASPLEKSSTKVSSLDDILNLLMKLDIVYQKRNVNNIVFIFLKEQWEEIAESTAQSLMGEEFIRMVTDCSVLPDIIRWLGKSNIIENTNRVYRNKKTPAIGAKHNNLVWDALAYTRATGINKFVGSKATTKETQTLVVLDVMLSNEYSTIHVDGFYERIQINMNSVANEKRKVMPIIVYADCSEHALNKIRKLGFIAFDISYIFGTKIYEVLSKTQQLSGFFQVNTEIDGTIESILTMISDAGQEDALKELRGTLFEFLMYPLLNNLFPNSTIERGKFISRLNSENKKEGYEYDYIIESSNPPEIVFVELKGYHSRATITLGDYTKKASLKWFFNKTFPFAVKEYKAQIATGKVAKAVYITSANFWEDGHEYLKKLNQTTLRSAVMNVGYDRELLLELLKIRGFKNEIKIIEKFYTQINDTLNKVDNQDEEFELF